MPGWAVNYDFLVFIGENSYGFSKVTGLAQEMEYEEIGEGGRNWSPVIVRKPGSKQGLLTLEHGMRTGSRSGSGLELKAGTILKNILVFIMNKNNIVKTCAVSQGIVTRIELGELNGLGKDILIEKLEIVHEGLSFSRGRT